MHSLVCNELNNGNNNVFEYGLQVTDRYYELVPENVINVDGTTIMWDVPVITGRTILTN